MIPRNAAIVLMESYGARGLNDEKHFSALRKEARRLLARDGIDDIPADFDALAEPAWKAYQALNLAIVKRGARFAHVMKVGKPTGEMPLDDYLAMMRGLQATHIRSQALQEGRTLSDAEVAELVAALWVSRS